MLFCNKFSKMVAGLRSGYQIDLKSSPTSLAPRSDHDMIEEILDITRQIARQPPRDSNSSLLLCLPRLYPYSACCSGGIHTKQGAQLDSIHDCL